MSSPWHSRTVATVLDELHSSLHGITAREAVARLERFGYNELTRGQRWTFVRALVGQFRSPLALVLVGALIVTLLLSEYADAVVLVIALCINVGASVAQEARASKIFEALEATQAPTAEVVRQEEHKIIPIRELVPGDVVELAGGHVVPADVRIFEAQGLHVNESMLTGEWHPVEKSEALEPETAPKNARKNMAWGGTVVVAGRGRGVVVETGAHSTIGTIATLALHAKDEHTPLSASVRRLATVISLLILAVLAAIFIVGLLRGTAVAEMLLISVAVAVSAMPEGLPAAVTITLALGMESILRRGGLVRGLLATETLGATTVILVDKTGTLTEGAMRIAHLYTARTLEHAGGVDHPDNRALIEMAVLASDAFVEHAAEGPVFRGRPVERSIIECGYANGIEQQKLFTQGHERLDFVQFESVRRFALSLNANPVGAYRVYASGAPEPLLAQATHCFSAGGARILDKETREHFMAVQRDGAAQGQKFLAVAYADTREKKITDDARGGTLEQLVFVGLLAIADHVRKDVPDAIREVEGAGVRIMMLTGDYPETARAVAHEVGINAEKMLTGEEMEQLSDEALATKLASCTVLARVLPEQKLRVVRVLKKHGEVVAMTGDGVNDAPALTAAHIGITVGSGTDVAKEAGDLVLLDNKFSTIVSAIREGRRVVDNLRSIVTYLLSTSASEVMVIGSALVMGTPLPLLPTQLLWTNIIHEGFMSIPYAFEPARTGVMREKPRGLGEAILTRKLGVLITLVSIGGSALLIGFYGWLLMAHLPAETMRSVMFVALSITALSFALSLKDPSNPLWRIPLLNNRSLLVSLSISIGILVLSVTLAPMRELLSLTTFPIQFALYLLGFAVANIVLIETLKVVARRFS